MSSSDDDAPLASKANGRRVVSASKITKAEDRALDKTVDAKKAIDVGLSIRNGPILDDPMEIDEPAVSGKRKSRASISEVNYKDEDSSEDEPLAKRQKPNGAKDIGSSEDEPIAKRKGKGKLPPSYKETDLPDDSDSDNEPLSTKLANTKAAIEKQAEKDAKKIRANEAKAKKSKARQVADEESSDEPLAKASSSRRQSADARRKSNAVKEERSSDVGLDSDSDSDAPIAKKKATLTAPKRKQASVKKQPTSDSDAPVTKQKNAGATTKGSIKKVKKSVKAESEDPGNGEENSDEEEFQWWNQPKKEDDSVKWTTLEHNGVMFPPPYQALPPHVKLHYDGQPVSLSLEAEEVAWFFGSMLHSKLNVDNETFQKNFFCDFKSVLKETGSAKDKEGHKVDIKDFSKLDFTVMHEYFMATNEARKARPSAVKKAETEERKVLELPYKLCVWDGRKEQVGNFRVEPPGLFRGRGEHPKTGMVKRRVMPEQITINIGKDAKVPEPPSGHQWKAVQHDNKATWLAMWQENVNNQYKYVMLAANSAIKGQSDLKKFEKARELKKYIDKIRKDYTKELKSDVMADRQRATAMYLIDKLALRAGNEKDTENEAETVGCCSLKFEHVTLKPPNIVVFDFLGKDSIRFHDEVTVDAQVFKNFKLFKRLPKKDGDDVFDRLNTSQLNKHLSSYMPGLTAKVFRTYNASYTMSEQLKALKDDGKSIAEKVALYNACNRKVAVLCNHKRTVGPGHANSMKKFEDKIKGLKYEMWRQKQMMLDIDSKQKKKKGADYFKLDENIDEAWVLEHQVSLVEQQRSAITKKFEKHVAEKKVAQSAKTLKELLKAADELAAKFKKENKTKKVEAEGRFLTVERIEASINKLDQKIQDTERDMQERDENKEVALGTSKLNYIDPRLTVVFSKKFGVPIERFFSKNLRDKFNWAIKSVEDEHWEF